MTTTTSAPNGFAPMFPGMMPPMPPMMPPMMGAFPTWGWSGVASQENSNAKAEEFASNMKSYWEKTLDMRKSSMDGSKDQYTQFFANLMDMQDGFTESLPDEVPAIPGLPPIPVSPKAFMESLKEFEEMANDHMVGQMDSCVDFYFQSAQKACDMIPEAEEAAEVEVEIDEVVEEA